MRSLGKLRAVIAFAIIAAIGIMLLPTIDRAKAEEPLEYPLNLLEGLDVTAGADIANEYVLSSKREASYGYVYRFAQRKGDWLVDDGEIIVSTDENDNVLSAFGEHKDVSSLQRAKLSPEQAAEIAGGNALSASRVIYGGEYAYDITTDLNGGSQFIVSAVDGDILYSAAKAVRGLGVPTEQKTYIDLNGEDINLDIAWDETNQKYVLADFIRNIFVLDSSDEMKQGIGELYTSTDGNFTCNADGQQDVTAVTLFNNMQKIYDFYADASNLGVSLKGVGGMNNNISGDCLIKNRDVYNFTSINGENGDEVPLYVFAHDAASGDQAGCFYDGNSNCSIMFVGDGNPTSSTQNPCYLYQPGKAIDIIAHEYQHAITGRAVGFEYLNDSGALDEAFSDIFGAIIEAKFKGYTTDNWQFWEIAEDALNITSQQTGTKVRTLDGTMDDQYSYNVADRIPQCNIPFSADHKHNTCDFGGVHQNSTIVTYVQFLLYKKQPEFFTLERIGTLWYNTLLTMTSKATFKDFGIKFMTAALNLGYSDDVFNDIKDSLTEVGIIDASNVHVVTFVDYDDTVLQKNVVEHNGYVVFDASKQPERKPDVQYSYKFTGWDKGLGNIQADTTIKAQYSQKLRQYTVSYLNGNNLIIQKAVDYGTPIANLTLDEMGSRAPSGKFYGWFLDKELTQPLDSTAIVLGDTVVYGKFEGSKSGSGDKKGGSCGTVTFGIGGSGGGGTGLMIGISLAAVLAAVLVAITLKKRKA